MKFIFFILTVDFYKFYVIKKLEIILNVNSSKNAHYLWADLNKTISAVDTERD
jgi:hypothetical protein